MARKDDDNTGKKTLTARQITDLEGKAADAGKHKKDLDAERRKTAKLEKEAATGTKAIEGLLREKAVLVESVAAKDATIKELEALVTDLQGALRKNGSVHPSELNRDLMEQTFHAAKIYLFRTVKFFEDDGDAEEKTKMLIQYLPNGRDSLGTLTDEEFAFKYKQAANKGIQAAKQSVQADGKKAAMGT